MGLLIVVIFVVVLLAGLVTSKVSHFGDGRYLAYTYRMQKSVPYKIMSTLLVICAFSILAITAWFLYEIYKTSPGVLANFVLYLLPTIVALVYSAVTLAKGSKDPFYDYESEEFLDIEFARSWS